MLHRSMGLQFMWGQSLSRFVPTRKTTSAGQFSSFVAGRKVVGNGRVIKIESPSDGVIVAEMKIVDAHVEIDEAVAYARRHCALLQPRQLSSSSGAFGATGASPSTITIEQPQGPLSIAERQAFLKRIAANIRAQSDNFARAESLSCGMCLKDARISVESSANCFDTIAALLTHPSEDRGPLSPEVITPAFDAANFSSTVAYSPVGVVALVTPFNYPLEMFAWKAAPALAAGNVVIWKPPEASPLSSFLMLDILDSEVDERTRGLVQIVQGDSSVGSALASHVGVDMIAFTGSTEVGKKIQASAAQSNLKRVQLELGGNGCVVASKSVFTPASSSSSPLGANVETLLDVAMQCFSNSGQSCTSSRRLYIPKVHAIDFIMRLQVRIGARKVGHALDSESDQGPLISAASLDRALTAVRQASTEPGVSLVAGGFATTFPAGYFMPPTVLYCTNPYAPIVQHELFAPVLCIIPYDGDDVSEAVHLANQCSLGLSSVVVANDATEAEWASKALQSGTVWNNCVDAMGAATPFGGWKQSGYGKDLGALSLRGYSNAKTITTKLNTVRHHQQQ